MIATDGRPTIAHYGSERLLRPSEPEHDFAVVSHGSVYTLRADSPLVEEWIEEHVGGKTQWFGDALVIEHRYVRDIVEALESEGFVGSFSA